MKTRGWDSCDLHKCMLDKNTKICRVFVSRRGKNYDGTIISPPRIKEQPVKTRLSTRGNVFCDWFILPLRQS